MDDIMNELYSEELINVNCDNCMDRDALQMQSYISEELSKVICLNLKRDVNQCIDSEF